MSVDLSPAGDSAQRRTCPGSRRRHEGAAAWESAWLLVAVALVGAGGLRALGSAERAAIAGEVASSHARDEASPHPRARPLAAPGGDPGAAHGVPSAQAAGASLLREFAQALDAVAHLDDAKARATALHHEYAAAYRAQVPLDRLGSSLHGMDTWERRAHVRALQEGLVGPSAGGHAILPTAPHLKDSDGVAFAAPYMPFKGTDLEGSPADALLGVRYPRAGLVDLPSGVRTVDGFLLPEDASVLLRLADWLAPLLSEALGRPMRRSATRSETHASVRALMGESDRTWHVDAPVLAAVTTLTGPGTEFVPNHVLDASPFRRTIRDGLRMYVDPSLIDFLGTHAERVPRGHTFVFAGARARDVADLFGGRPHGALMHTSPENRALRATFVSTYEPVP